MYARGTAITCSRSSSPLRALLEFLCHTCMSQPLSILLLISPSAILKLCEFVRLCLCSLFQLNVALISDLNNNNNNNKLLIIRARVNKHAEWANRDTWVGQRSGADGKHASCTAKTLYGWLQAALHTCTVD